MAAFEKLMLIIDADGKGAIREVNGVAKSVDKLSASEKKLDRVAAGMVSIGSAAVAAGAVAGLGLAKAAKAAGDLEAAVSTTEQVFGAASGDIQSFAADSAKNFGLSKRAANEAAVGFGAFAKQAGLTGQDLSGFSIDLLKLAADLAAFKNVSVDEAVQALTSGLAGESEPLRRFGIDVRDVALQAEYAAQTGEKFTGTLTQQQKTLLAQSTIMRQAYDIGIIDQFSREQGQLGTSLAQLQAQWEDALASFGQAALPAATQAVGALTSVVETFGKVNTATDGAVGKLATFATAATVVGGGLSVVIGKAIQMRDAFVMVGEDGTRSMTKLGRAASAVTFAGILYGVYEIGRALEAATADAEGFEKALKSAAGATSTEEISASLQDAASSVEGFFDKLNNSRFVPNKGLNDPSILVGPKKLRVEVDNLKQAVEDAFERGDTAAVENWLKVLRDTDNVQFVDPIFGLQQLNPLLSEYERRLGDAGSATEGGAVTAEQLSGAMASVGIETTSASAALKEFADAVQSALDPVFATTDAFEQNTKAKMDVVKATADLAKLEREGKKGTEEYAAAQQTLADANQAQVKSAMDVQGALGNLLQTVKENPAAWQQAGAALDQWVASGLITAEQAQTVRGEILNAVGAAEEADRTKAEMEIKANVTQAITAVSAATEAARRAAAGDYTLIIRANIGGIISQLNTVQTIAQTTAGVVAAVNAATPTRKANGGFTSFAAGGMLPGQATIAPGRGRGLVQWAEGETGGEAFIPLAPAKRKRSKDLWWETGRRLGVIQMAQGGFTADTLWGAIAESQQNRSQFLFETASPAEQWNDLNRRLAQLHQFSDGWMDVQRQIMRMQQETADEQRRAQEEQLAAAMERADNEWQYTYDRADLEQKLLLAAQRQSGFEKWSDQWTQWQRELDRLTEDAKTQLSPVARQAASRGLRSDGALSINLTVNVNGPAAGEPIEFGRATVNALREYFKVSGGAAVALGIST